jgi:hypothetical protein
MVVENFPNPGKNMNIHVQDAFRTPTIHDQKRTSP